MMKKVAMAAMAIFLAGAISACAPKETKIHFAIQRDRIIDQVVQNTRTVKAYRELDTVLIADVLWYRPEIRKSLVAEVKAEGRIDGEQEKAMLAEIAANDDKEIEFLAGIVTGDRRWNDFDREDSMWRITLKAADGVMVTPSSIEKMKQDKMQDAWLFPFISDWKTMYRIKFKKSPEMAGSSGYSLRFSSVVGEGTFNWDFKQTK